MKISIKYFEQMHESFPLTVDNLIWSSSYVKVIIGQEEKWFPIKNREYIRIED